MVIPSNTSYSAETMESLAIQIDEAKKELAEAEENQKAAAERYGTGSLGFIDWMLAKEGLEEWQKSDLDAAKSIITGACEENFSRWGIRDTGLPASRNNMVTCLGDIADAIALPNLRWSLSILRDINGFRATDENYIGVMKRNEAKTSFALWQLPRLVQTGQQCLKGIQYYVLTVKTLLIFHHILLICGGLRLKLLINTKKNLV